VFVLTLSPHQRQAMEMVGTPLQVVDPVTGQAWLLLEVVFAPGMLDGVQAQIAGLPGLGRLRDRFDGRRGVEVEELLDGLAVGHAGEV
jgi:hypothetical protein